MKRIPVLLLSCLLFATASYAATPEKMAQTYFERLKQRQWTRVAELYDVQALKEFRQMMSFLLLVPDDAAPKVLGTFFGAGATKESIKAMSDKAFFTHFLRGIMARAEQVGQLDFEKVEVLGSVSEGSSVRHVVTRIKVGIGDMSMENMEIISFRKKDGHWGILLQGKIKGMARQIRRALER